MSKCLPPSESDLLVCDPRSKSKRKRNARSCRMAPPPHPRPRLLENSKPLLCLSAFRSGQWEWGRHSPSDWPSALSSVACLVWWPSACSSLVHCVFSPVSSAICGLHEGPCWRAGRMLSQGVKPWIKVRDTRAPPWPRNTVTGERGLLVASGHVS